MNKDQMRIAIALHLGAKWRLFGSGYTWLTFKFYVEGFETIEAPDDPAKVIISESVPNYPESLDAMHEAEQWLFASKPGYYERAWYANLVNVVTELDPSNDGWGDVDTRQHAYSGGAFPSRRTDADNQSIPRRHRRRPNPANAPKEILIAARALIAEPEHWTQSVLARNRNGEPVPPLNVEAFCFCSAGAIHRIAEDLSQHETTAAFVALETVIIGEARGNAITDFNDDPKRTHAEILAKFDQAINSLT